MNMKNTLWMKERSKKLFTVRKKIFEASVLKFYNKV